MADRISVNDKINSYAVENVAMTDTDDTAELFYFEIVEDSEEVIQVPDISDVIKVNII